MDMVVAGGLVVLENDLRPLHIGIKDGRIASLTAADEPVPSAARIVDASGLVVVPGAIDAHTHFTGAHDDYIPEIAAGTRGAAKAGVTTVIEMPHANPPATTLESFLAKKALFEDHAVVDFGLWGGIDGTRLEELKKMNDAGAAAMKGFMCSGRLDGKAGDERSLPMLDDDDLVNAMRAIATFGGVIGLHAENHFIIQGRRAALQEAGRTDARAHAESQPEIAETEAVARAIFLARQTGVHLHVVHLSSSKAAALITEARRDMKVTVETCPQYLVLDEEDLVRIGGIARCGPPIRPSTMTEALWSDVLGGRIDALTSDHCPYPVARKSGSVIWDAAMGLTGIETTTPLFFSAAVGDRGMSLIDFARMSSTGPARIFGLYGRKGAIGMGFDADLVLMDPTVKSTVKAESFEGQAKWSAYDGMDYSGAVVDTIIRGVPVYGRSASESFKGAFVPRAGTGY